MPARLFGVKEETGAKIEVLLLKQLEGDQWETLVKPAKRVKEGTEISFGEGILKAICIGTARPRWTNHSIFNMKAFFMKF